MEEMCSTGDRKRPRAEEIALEPLAPSSSNLTRKDSRRKVPAKGAVAADVEKFLEMRRRVR